MKAMQELEKQAERLLGELTELRRTNRNLAARVKKLEKSARAAEPKLDRAELRRRLERLIERLEALAGDG